MRRYTRFGCLLAALWLVLAMMGASPQLHHKLHEEANSPEHSCVIEHIGEGAFVFSPDPVVATSAPEPLFSSFAISSDIPSSRDFRVAPSRGPPSLPTSRMVAG